MGPGTDHGQADEHLKLRADGIVWRQVGDELVLLDVEGGRYLSVNQTGAILWPLLVEGCRAGRLVEQLMEHYGVPAEQASEDTSRFLASMRELGVLEATSSR